jgi:hypothetical protein
MQGISYYVGLLACVIIAWPSTAHGQITWYGWAGSIEYGSGFNPSVAVSGVTVVEVQNNYTTPGPLYYRVGQRGYEGKVDWGPRYLFELNGFNPTVAIFGSTVVEVHNAGSAAGTMSYRVGQVIGSTIDWGPSQAYDFGFNPSVAIAMDTTGLVAVEVHNGGSTAGTLWYHVGKVDASTIEWGPSHPYDYGFNPSVSIAACSAADSSGTASCIEAIEVHNGGDLPGPMLVHSGFWASGFGSTIIWGTSFQYDHGWNPKVAFSIAPGEGRFGHILEVHNGDAGAMWYHLGSFSWGFLCCASLQMGLPYHYDSGWNPSVALDWTNLTAIEVHDGDASALWYHLGQLYKLR